MNNDVSAPSAQADGAALPPPRAFGDSHTLTVPRSRRTRTAAERAARLWDGVSADAVGHTRVAVVPADSTPLTITF